MTLHLKTLAQMTKKTMTLAQTRQQMARIQTLKRMIPQMRLNLKMRRLMSSKNQRLNKQTIKPLMMEIKETIRPFGRPLTCPQPLS